MAHPLPYAAVCGALRGTNSGNVLRVPLAGGAATTLATGQVNPDAIAVDATSVYWIDNGDAVMKFTPK